MFNNESPLLLTLSAIECVVSKGELSCKGVICDLTATISPEKNKYARVLVPAVYYSSEQLYAMLTLLSPLRSSTGRLSSRLPPPPSTYNRTIFGLVKLQPPGLSRFYPFASLSWRHFHLLASSTATCGFRRALPASGATDRCRKDKTHYTLRHKGDNEPDIEAFTGCAALEEDAHPQSQATGSSQMARQRRESDSAGQIKRILIFLTVFGLLLWVSRELNAYERCFERVTRQLEVREDTSYENDKEQEQEQGMIPRGGAYKTYVHYSRWSIHNNTRSFVLDVLPYLIVVLLGLCIFTEMPPL